MYKLSVFVGVLFIIPLVLSLEIFQCGKEGTLVPGEKLAERLKACNEPKLYEGKDLKCIAACTTEAVGGLKDGVPDKGLFTNLIKAEFPESEQAPALERLDKCFEGITFDKDDKTCSATAEFSACGTKLVVETKC